MELEEEGTEVRGGRQKAQLGMPPPRSGLPLNCADPKIECHRSCFLRLFHALREGKLRQSTRSAVGWRYVGRQQRSDGGVVCLVKILSVLEHSTTHSLTCSKASGRDLPFISSLQLLPAQSHFPHTKAT